LRMPAGAQGLPRHRASRFRLLADGQYPNEDDMAAVRKGQAMAPIGKPLVAAEVPLPRTGASAAALPLAASSTAAQTSAAVSTPR
jgi:hypothetical protein